MSEYQGEVIVAFTLCLKHRPRFFVSTEIVSDVVGILLKETERFHCELEAYVFMPDHCHLILRGATIDSDVYRAVKMFKQKTGYWLSINYPSIRWQKDFYDHIIRNADAVGRNIHYVLANPVRAECTSDWKAYPFKGSTVHNLDEWD